MDFASLMSKEIAKSKPPRAQSSEPQADKQYVRRSELEAARLAAYNAEQERIQKEREERAEKKRKIEEDEAERNRVREEKRRRLAEESRRRREAEEEAKEAERRKRLGLSATPAAEKTESEKESTPLEGEEGLSQEELVEKLRNMGEPSRLFGESDKGRLKRYRRLVQRSITPRKQLSDGPIPTTLELLPEAEMKVPEKVPANEEGKKYLFRQLASYFTMVLKEWEIALAKRDASVKNTFQGRQAYNAMVQSREYMKPLFKKFENADVEDSILGPIVEIVRNAQHRRYVDANDGYLRLSIGKAAWPIGVTMVGIHERSAREKLHEGGQDKAHIMSDESTRKFLQSIKRCLTFAQVRWPPDDQLQLMG
ncbi:conserved hypothetical protein [Uncinocarpus reesii 1704]|uniref:Pre-mRNA-splicing factor 18 n=1 Tax=Uncinocarpus reesii (strain UAMH 1704) TaxID=336963 RepID=C4JM45_UNCRE|nr:uncharacterized protein UREG_03903 [Uncinocarpus reesii 1704]EEP79057.1 conserved hypothetical protein [Uncinocarpus reesii 1704]